MSAEVVDGSCDLRCHDMTSLMCGGRGVANIYKVAKGESVLGNFIEYLKCSIQGVRTHVLAPLKTPGTIRDV